MPSLAWPRKTLSGVGTKEAPGLLLMLLFWALSIWRGPCLECYHFVFESRIKRPCEEKSVDVEKLESSWGTIGEQLLPNKTLLARIPGFHPP